MDCGCRVRRGHRVHLADSTMFGTTIAMHTLSFSEARAHLKATMDKVVADRASVAITRQRGEGVVMVSASEWEGMEETLYLLSSPANAKRLLDGAARMDAR